MSESETIKGDVQRIPESKLDELQGRHGKIFVTEICGVEFAVRKPQYQEWRRFEIGTFDAVRSGGVEAINASEDLVKRCCVSHTSEELRNFANSPDGTTRVYSLLRELIEKAEKREVGPYSKSG